MPVTVFKRFEMKFILSGRQYGELAKLLQSYMIPDKYCQNDNEYHVYNLYYDTYDSSIIRTSLEKPYYKEKLRLRSYESPVLCNDTVFLELKKKINGIVSKRRAAMTLQEAYDFINSGTSPHAADYMNRQVISELGYFISCRKVRPAAYISYTRKALYGKENRDFRITFDHDIITRREEVNLESYCLVNMLLDNGQYLMEIKITDSVPIWLSNALGDLHIYKTNFSKYGNEYKNYCLQKDINAINVGYGVSPLGTRSKTG